MKIIIIDDNPAVLRTLRLVLSQEFGTIVTMPGPQVLPALLMAGDVDAVLLDMNFDSSRLDGSDGLFWLERIKSVDNPPAVVMITAFGELPLAVEAMKAGAEDFITKPWDNDRLIAALRNAIGRNRSERLRRQTEAEADTMRRHIENESRMSLGELKSQHIRRIVDECGGNLSQAAAILGINRQTLYNQLKKER